MRRWNAPLSDERLGYGRRVALASFVALAFFCVFVGCGGDKNAGGETAGTWNSLSAESGSGSGANGFAIETKGYGESLAKYVDEKGLVDYAGWQSGRAGLDSYIANIARQDYADLRAQPDAEQLAFWFNAYNAITVKYILDHHPIKKGGIVFGTLYPANSIRQIKGVWDSLKTPVAGRELTLDEIEHEVLRAQFSEPRLHVALVCAARSCPPLRNEPYTADMLDEQLDDQARKFLKSQHGLQIDREHRQIRVSTIFDWYGGDFTKTFGSPESLSDHNEAETAVLHFVARYGGEAAAAYIDEAEYSLRYLDYDWTLNEQ